MNFLLSTHYKITYYNIQDNDQKNISWVVPLMVSCFVELKVMTQQLHFHINFVPIARNMKWILQPNR